MSRYKLFEVYGIELEYMIVNRAGLQVMPIADELLKRVEGSYVSDHENGTVDWSNELVNHVIELKTAVPVRDIEEMNAAFSDNVREINSLLKPMDACLLGTGAHPLMDPLRETVLWPHEYREIYQLYNRIFDCRGHGWSNLQSAHLNLPFDGDAEFGPLHAAVRLLLPAIPALAASTPIFEGAITGMADSRIDVYRLNQKEIPLIGGYVIPEPVFTTADYQKEIFDPITRALRFFDTDNILDKYFVNSRGAIARFDRGSIEIRLIDLQESPRADLAIIHLMVEVLKSLVSERWVSLQEQKTLSERALLPLLLSTTRLAENAILDFEPWLRCFGFSEKEIKAGEFWQKMFEEHRENLAADEQVVLRQILKEGTLSTRITRALPTKPQIEDIRGVYQKLATCLAENRIFLD